MNKLEKAIISQIPRGVKILAITLTLAIGCEAIKLATTKLNHEIEGFIPAYAQTQPEAIKEKELTIKEHVWKILTEEYDFTLDEKIDFLSVIRCESGFNPYAINVNKDGSLDLGIAQWNMKYHAKTMTRECAFDVYCAVRAMADTYKKEGNLNKWVCAK